MNVVTRYIDARYNADYNNIRKKVEIQKELFDKSFIDKESTYTMFDNDIDMFVNNQLIVKITDKNIYKKEKVNGNVEIGIQFSYDIVSELEGYPSYKRNADWIITLTKVKWNKYLIKEITVNKNEIVPINIAGDNEGGHEHNHIYEDKQINEVEHLD